METEQPSSQGSSCPACELDERQLRAAVNEGRRCALDLDKGGTHWAMLPPRY